MICCTSALRAHRGQAPSLRRLLASGAGATALLAAAPAFAQTASAPAAAGAEPAAVAEVVVTANKSAAQKVIEAPASIQAISGDQLRKAGDAGFLDIAAQVPGLSIQDLGPGDRKYVIRGVNSNGDATAGVYYDEAVISGSNANDGGGFESDIRLYDLDHIEVLRGPQGTLYGASSMSGTIRFITKKPDLDNFGGYVTVEASDTSHGGGNYNVNGEVNVPIIDDKLALRVVGWELSDSGYINQVRVGAGTSDPVGLVKGVNNDDVGGGRISLRFQPIEALTIDASYTNQTETSNGSSRYTPAGTTAFQIPGAPTIQGCDLCNTDVTRSPWGDSLSVYSLTANYKFQYGTITATTNQYDRKIDFSFDSTPILVSYGVPVPAETLEPQKRDLNSSEIRYASSFDFPVNVVVGAFRQYETNDLTVNVLTTDGQGQVTGPFSTSNSQDALLYPGVGDTFFGRVDDRTTTEYAGFGEATWKVTSRLTVVAGMRYFTETLSGIGQTTHDFGGCGTTDCNPNPYPTASATKLTYKVNASYKFSDELLVYATAAEGFRGGGLNAPQFILGIKEPIPVEFNPDALWNYEVGAKGRLFDGRLQYQVDAYTLFWYNIQVPETTADGAFNYTGNAGDAVVKGFEFEFDARPIQHLTVSFAGSYQDAYLLKGASAEQYVLNPTLGLSGDAIPGVAPFQFNLGLNYTAPLVDDWNGTLAGDVSYRGSENSYFASNAFNIPLRPYTLLNVRAGVSKGPWSANLFVHNLTDDRAQVSAINSTQDPDALLTVQPRTVGMNVTRTF